MKKQFVFSLLMGLTGCSLFPEGKAPPPLYILKSGSIAPSLLLKKSLAVNCPRSEPSLDTYRIAVTLPPYRRDYLAGAQWPETLPTVLQEIFMESFTERWGGAVINRMEDGLESAYGLYSNIYDFSVYPKTNGLTEVRLKISMRLIDFHSRKILASHIFSEKICVISPTLESVVAAFNQGLQRVLNQAMEWIESVTGKERETSPLVLQR